MIRKKLLIIASIISLGLATVALPVYAKTASGGGSGSSGSGAEVEDPCKKHASEFPELCTKGSETDAKVKVGKILNVIYGLIGIIAVVFVIIGGFKYMTSQGEPGRVQQAKNTIMYALIGLAVTLSAFAITNFILQALGA